MSSSKRKSEKLGMPYGTASNRLRKSIIFHLLKRLGEDVCYVCGKVIDDIDTLSIEHKKPWENDSVDLFWNLDNIAFSHLRCNRQHNSGGAKLRKVAPDGKEWCTGCQDFIDRDKFYVVSSRWNGVHAMCKECRSEDDKKVRDRKKHNG